MMELLASPTFVGLLQAAGVGLLVILAAASQRFGKRADGAGPASKDVIVPTVTVADRVALEQLAETLRDSNRVARDHREHDTEILYEIRALNATMSRIESAVTRLMDHLPDRENGARVLSLLGRIFDHQRSRAD